jgi:hypothetical protein
VFQRTVRLLAQLLVAALCSGSAGAYTLTSDDGRFSVELPAKPGFKQRRIQRVRDGAIFESNEWRLDQPWITWQVSYRDHSQNADDATADKIFNRVLLELPASLGGDLRLFRYIERDGTQGLEVRIFVPRNRMLLRSQIFVVGTRQYNISYVGPDGSEIESVVETYLNSFHILP